MRILPLVAAAAAAILPGVANAAVLDLQTDAVTVTVGETFDVRLVIDREMQDQLIGGLQADLDFTSDTLAFVSGTFGPALGDTGNGDVSLFDGDTVSAFAISDNPSDLAGLQPDMFVGLTLTFRALAEGRGEVELLGDLTALFGPDLADVLFRIADDDVNVLVDVAPIPLPAGALLLLTGLAGGAAARRARG